MHAARYRIPDEPRPTGLIRYAVDPMWPLLALMLSGNALGLAWFAFNSRALGSATAARESAYILASVIGCVLLTLAIGWARQNGVLDDSAIQYAALAFPALKLSLGYALYVSQSRSTELILHFGGVLRNGAVGLLVCFVIARSVLDTLQVPAVLVEVLR